MTTIKKILFGLLLLLLSTPLYANCQGEGLVSFAFNNIEIRSALQLLSDFANVKVVIAQDIAGSHPMFFTCENWAEVIRQISIKNNLTTQVIDGVLYINKLRN